MNVFRVERQAVKVEAWLPGQAVRGTMYLAAYGRAGWEDTVQALLASGDAFLPLVSPDGTATLISRDRLQVVWVDDEEKGHFSVPQVPLSRFTVTVRFEGRPPLTASLESALRQDAMRPLDLMNGPDRFVPIRLKGRFGLLNLDSVVSVNLKATAARKARPTGSKPKKSRR